MTIRTLDKAQRQHYFERVSSALVHTETDVEVTGLGVLPASEPQWTQLRGVAYDPAKDAFELVTDDLDHLILEPIEVHVDVTDDGLQGIEIIDAEGQPRTVRLRSPLPLAGPSAAG